MNKKLPKPAQAELENLLRGGMDVAEAATVIKNVYGITLSGRRLHQIRKELVLTVEDETRQQLEELGAVVSIVDPVVQAKKIHGFTKIIDDLLEEEIKIKGLSPEALGRGRDIELRMKLMTSRAALIRAQVSLFKELRSLAALANPKKNVGSSVDVKAEKVFILSGGATIDDAVKNRLQTHGINMQNGVAIFQDDDVKDAEVILDESQLKDRETGN